MGGCIERVGERVQRRVEVVVRSRKALACRLLLQSQRGAGSSAAQTGGNGAGRSGRARAVVPFRSRGWARRRSHRCWGQESIDFVNVLLLSRRAALCKLVQAVDE